MLRYFHIALIYVIGAALSFVGSYLKTELSPYASQCLLLSTAFQGFAIATLVFKIIKQKGFKE